MTDQALAAQGTYGTQRRNAARNRAGIIEAAHELFAADPLVPLTDIAKKAGVGIGTLYRHFPTRDEEVLARHTSAKDAFIEWFETLSAYIRIKHGLGDALHSAAAQQAVSASWAPASAAVGKLLDACAAEGTIAPGRLPADVIMLMSFLWRVANNDDGARQGRRLIATVFDGLSAAPRAL